MLDFTIRELRPELADDYLRFFDTDAFADNPGWSHCYCAFYDHENWGDLPSNAETRDYIRAHRAKMIRCGQASGLLAYSDGKVVGWCNAGPRGACRNLQHIAKAVDGPVQSIGSIRCFVVAPECRGRGIATALLNGACEMFARQGLSAAEAYPKTQVAPTAEGVPVAALNYHGPLEMYLNSGFVIHRNVDGLTVVRRALTPAQPL